MSGQAIYLIDFDNVRPDADQPFSRRDVCQAADYVRQQAIRHAYETLHVDEARLRLYGGWYLRRGDFSYDAKDITRWLPTIRGRDRTTGLRVGAELATALLVSPTNNFQGTLRVPDRHAPPHANCSKLCPVHCASRSSQKMVDMMLGVDLVTIAAREPVHIVLFTEDEDLFPAVVAASAANQKAASINWIRPGRSVGASPNDQHLHLSQVRISEAP